MVSYRSSPTNDRYDQMTGPPGYRDRAPRRPRWLLFLIPVFVVFVVFGTIVWLAYVEGAPASGGGEPPLVRADTEPIKLPPDDPGGREVTARGAVGELLGEDRPGDTERLLPLPEEPLAPPTPEELAAAASRLEAALDDALAEGAGNAEAAPEAAGAAAGAGADDPRQDAQVSQGDPPPTTEAAIRDLLQDSPSGAARPTVLRPGPVQPSGQASQEPPQGEQLSRDTPAVPAEPEAQPRPSSQETGASTATEASAEAGPRREAGASGSGAAPDEAPEADSAVADQGAEERTVTPALAPSVARPPEPADPALLEGPHFRVQLAAVRSEADAQRAWDLFRADYTEVLAGLDPIFERGETTNGVFYRVQLGPYGDLTDAEAMCEELKQRNASCFVLRR